MSETPPQLTRVDGSYINMADIAHITPMMVGGIVIGFSGGGEIRVSDNAKVREQLRLPPKIQNQ